MDIRNGDLPCDPRYVRRDTDTRTPLPDGRVKVTRDIWFIDRSGSDDWISESWIEGEPAGD